MFKFFRESLVTSQIAATLIAMQFNYFANLKITFRHSRSKQGKSLSMFLFILISVIGGICNLACTLGIYEVGFNWFISGLSGAILGAIVNFSLSKKIIWSEV
jgi:dolichol-phosphate mannosyltransferase